MKLYKGSKRKKESRTINQRQERKKETNKQTKKNKAKIK